MSHTTRVLILIRWRRIRIGPPHRPLATRQSPSPGGRCRTPADRLAYSVDEAARLTGLSRDLRYDEMRHGNLTYVKVGRRRLITRHHLRQFLGESSGRQM